ncbi:nucleoside monophosphate kinase [Streptomyces coelicoflavus]|uniref:nucleoside monophosphate kinase n=1 Tax=Streptomyces coelicoflavus TaxID=285562 RepID=UPI0027E312EB|nr:nucleoside monophosphate kinase [Streptomyces coelicoflavus]
MADPTEEQLDPADVYARELTNFAEALHVLHVDRGSPSYRAVSAAAETAGRVSLSSSAISEAFSGKRLPSLDFTLELVRQLAGPDQEVREDWRERWKRVKLCQRQSVARRRQSKPQHETGHSTQRGPLDSGRAALSAVRLEAERIIQAAQAEAETIIESARIRADEMTASATQMLLDATERGTIPVAERLRLREHTRIALAGPPGSGKGTQSPFLSKLLEVPFIHLGELYRSNIAGRTPVGKVVYGYMNRGELVPDEVMLEMLADRLRAPDTQHGFILDGLPRNLNQAIAVDDLLSATSEGIEAVLNFDISRDESFRRVIGRRVCKNDSSHLAHVTYATPQKYGRCDVCGGPLYTREDDSRDVVAKRWDVWKSMTEPVVQKYGAEGRLVTVSGIGPVSSVTERALTALNAYFG